MRSAGHQVDVLNVKSVCFRGTAGSFLISKRPQSVWFPILVREDISYKNLAILICRSKVPFQSFRRLTVVFK